MSDEEKNDDVGDGEHKTGGSSFILIAHRVIIITIRGKAGTANAILLQNSNRLQHFVAANITFVRQRRPPQRASKPANLRRRFTFIHSCVEFNKDNKNISYWDSNSLLASQFNRNT